MRVALLCDVGHPVYHVGDEAIGIASAAQLTTRGHDVVMISRAQEFDPSASLGSNTLASLSFPWPLAERHEYLASIRRVLAGDRSALPADDKLFTFIEAMKSVDALVIGGGGSLNSTYGWLLLERVASAMVATSLGIPVVLSGQSLGPFLLASDRSALAELLDSCLVVGVRDQDSYELATQLCPDHPAIFHTLDDAVLLDANWNQPKENRISVTLGDNPDPYREDDYVAVMAGVIDGLAERTGAAVEFVPHRADVDSVPHEAHPDMPLGDNHVHLQVAAAMKHSSSLAPIEVASASANHLAGAKWVVTTRFHPVVFGLMSGAQLLPVTLGLYARSRVDGALRNWGQSNSHVPFASLWNPAARGISPAVDQILDDLVATGTTDPATVRAQRHERLQAANSWWDQLVAVLESAKSGAAEPIPGQLDGVPVLPLQSDHALAGEQLTPFMSATPTEAAVLTGIADDHAVAIIMRTKDRPEFLDRAIQDVLSQTWADWQLVVVNDGGDSGLVKDVLDRYQGQLGDRLTLVNNPTSHGMEAASNLGLAQSRSEFVVVHDDDDTWHPRFLHETVAHLRTHPEEQAVATRTEIVVEHRIANEWVVYERFPSWPELHSIRLIDFIKLNRIVPICLLYRRSVHETLGGFAEDYPVIGDYVFHLRLLQEGNIGFIDEPLANWHHRPETSDATSSNSMYAAAGDHAEYDLLMRDRALKEWTADNGLGLPLFISKELEREADRLDHHLSQLTDALDHQGHQLDEILAPLRVINQVTHAKGIYRRAKQGYGVARGYVNRAKKRVTGR